MNLCRGCGQDFSSVRTFDRHRVGKHEYLASDERPDGRRCLTIEEMEEIGWEQDVRARWFDPAEVQRARASFGRPDTGCTVAA